MALSCVVSEIFNVEKCDLEMGFNVIKVVPISVLLVMLSLKRTVF